MSTRTEISASSRFYRTSEAGEKIYCDQFGTDDTNQWPLLDETAAGPATSITSITRMGHEYFSWKMLENVRGNLAPNNSVEALDDNPIDGIYKNLVANYIVHGQYQAKQDPNATELVRIGVPVVDISSAAPAFIDFDDVNVFGFTGQAVQGMTFEAFSGDTPGQMGMRKSLAAGQHQYILWLEYAGDSTSNDEGPDCIKVAIDGPDDGNKGSLTQTYYFNLVKDTTTLSRRYLLNSITDPSMHVVMEAAYNYSFSGASLDKLAFDVLEPGLLTEALSDYQLVDEFNRSPQSTQGLDGNERKLYPLPQGAGFQGLVGRESTSGLSTVEYSTWKGATNGFKVMAKDIKLQSSPSAFDADDNATIDTVYQFPNTQLSWSVDFLQNSVGLLDMSGELVPSEVESINEFALVLTDTELED